MKLGRHRVLRSTCIMFNFGYRNTEVVTVPLNGRSKKRVRTLRTQFPCLGLVLLYGV